MNQISALLIATFTVCAAGCMSTPASKSAVSAAPTAQKAPPAASAINITGSWDVTTETPQGPLAAQLDLAQTGDALSGTLATQMGSVLIKGSVVGDKMSFNFDFEPQGGGIVPIEYIGNVAGDTISGEATFGSYGSGAFKATRRK